MDDKEETKKEVATESAPKISYEDFKKVEIKVGEILSAEKVLNSEKLYRLMVNFNEAAPRQIVSGVAKFFPDEKTLVGKRCMFVTNLAPRKLMGLESDGMLFAVGDDDTFSLLEPAPHTPPGSSAR